MLDKYAIAAISKNKWSLYLLSISHEISNYISYTLNAKKLRKQIEIQIDLR